MRFKDKPNQPVGLPVWAVLLILSLTAGMLATGGILYMLAKLCALGRLP